VSRNRPKPSARVRRGFTLLELALSAGIVSLIMASLASVIVLASRALPSGTSAAASLNAAGSAADLLAEDLRFATRIIEASPTRISFTVPDRTGDGLEETIVYSWAGAGAPLQQQINQQSPVVLVDALALFELSLSRQKHTTTQVASGTQRSEEVLLSSFTGWPGVTPTVSFQSVTGTTWVSQKFVVDRFNIPSNATSWRITRVSMRMRRPSTAGNYAVTVGIHNPTTATGFIASPLPIGTPGVVPSASLTTTTRWQDAAFSNVFLTDTSLRHFVIVVKPEVPTNSASVEYFSSTSAPTDAYVYQYTTDGGLSWLPTTNRQRNDAQFFVYGDYEVAGTSVQTTDHYTLEHVGFILQTTGSGRTRIESAVQLANQPEVPAP
jgi:type II secretory pathway component PulJ